MKIVYSYPGGIIRIEKSIFEDIRNDAGQVFKKI